MKVSLGELAAMAGMPSEPTLRKMIAEHADFPVLARGTNGVAYEFDAELACAFVKSLREREEEKARARAAEVRQFNLEYLGADAVVDQSSVGLSASERKALLEEELIAMKVAERRGELVRKSTVDAAIAAVFDLLSQRRRSLSARLAKRTDLTRQQQTLLDQLLERESHDLAEKFEEMSRHGVPSAGAEDTAI